MRKLFAVLLTISLLLACFAVTSQAVSRVVATPYGPAGRGFHWYTDTEEDSVAVINGVEYEGTGALFKEGWAHSVFAENLAPGTDYTWTIKGDPAGTARFFRTDPGRGEAVNFLVTGDVQASDAAGFAYSARTIGAAWGKYPDADFTVVLGDHTNDSTNEQWDLYFDAFSGIHARAAYVPIAGNHDGLLKWNWFRNMFTLKEKANPFNATGVYYSFDWGDAHIAVLNSNDMYPMSTAQQNWLVNDMSATDAKWKLVFLHKSLYSAGNDANAPDVILLRRTLIPLFDKLGIDLVMSGHDHQYLRTLPMKADRPACVLEDLGETIVDPWGTVYIMPGAACNKRYAIKDAGLPSIKKAAAKHEEPGKPVFSSVRIDGDTLKFEAYTYDQATDTSEPYDEIEIVKTRFPAPDPRFEPLTTNFLWTIPGQLLGLVTGLPPVIFVDYLFLLLPQLIKGWLA